ncbi:MAG: SprT family zinc-dependent metalloprotease [Methanoregula sp.]|nr:SprT family zinc-dependent metalloprotease [Methanoregula sp.]
MANIKIDKIIRSKRKTIALVVTKESQLIIRAPFYTPLDYIEKIVSKKSVWIKQKIAEISKQPKAQKKEFVNGEGFLFLGKPYQLQIVENHPLDIELKDRLYIAQNALPNIEKKLTQWYRNQAIEKITERCFWYSKLTGYHPISIKITDAQKRWGSCSAKGTVNFSWHLILAPLEVIDYVIVHELIHLEEPNHSKIFWIKVRSILPDYEKRKNWLKNNERLLKM